MPSPLVSVIIPTYNAEKYIAEAIDSVLNQTFADFEIIIIDDGSTDDTVRIIEKYNGLIKYYYQKNSGPAAARNLGVTYARGKYIAFLDSDDWWLPNKIEIQLSSIESHPEVAFICSDWFQGTTGNEKKLSVLKNYKAWHYNRECFDILILENFVNTSTVLVRRIDLINDCFFNEEFLGAEDYHLWLKLLRHRDAVVIKHILAFRRFHKSNTSSTIKYLRSQIDMMQNLLQWSEIKTDLTRVTHVKGVLYKMNISLGYQLAMEKAYDESAQIYRGLLLMGYKPFHSLTRYIIFSLLGRIYNQW